MRNFCNYIQFSRPLESIWSIAVHWRLISAQISQTFLKFFSFHFFHSVSEKLGTGLNVLFTTKSRRANWNERNPKDFFPFIWSFQAESFRAFCPCVGGKGKKLSHKYFPIISIGNSLKHWQIISKSTNTLLPWK